jgi:hypothetical protein
MFLTENNKIWLLGFAIPLLTSLIGKILFGMEGMIYGVAITYAVEIVAWGFKHSEE